MDLRRTFVLANEFKEGDLPVGGTNDARLRNEADVRSTPSGSSEIVPAAFVEDGVTEALERSLNPRPARRGRPSDRRRIEADPVESGCAGRGFDAIEAACGARSLPQSSR